MQLPGSASLPLPSGAELLQGMETFATNSAQRQPQQQPTAASASDTSGAVLAAVPSPSPSSPSPDGTSASAAAKQASQQDLSSLLQDDSTFDLAPAGGSLDSQPSASSDEEVAQRAEVPRRQVVQLEEAAPGGALAERGPEQVASAAASAAACVPSLVVSDHGQVDVRDPRWAAGLEAWCWGSACSACMQTCLGTSLGTRPCLHAMWPQRPLLCCSDLSVHS
jgi:hypothetical protein